MKRSAKEIIASSKSPSPEVYAKLRGISGCDSFVWKFMSDSPSLLHGHSLPYPPPRQRIAAFDIDGTLLETKTSSPFPSSITDYRFISPSIPLILKHLSETHTIVLFTNQKNIHAGKGVRLTWFIHKMHQLSKDFQFILYAALEDDVYRKPNIGMWIHATKELQFMDGFYVGDAAGRPGDHSSADIGFATAASVLFYTPEMFFSSICFSKYNVPDALHPLKKYLGKSRAFIPSAHQEVILLVGSPCSGKSTFTLKFFSSYTIVSLDLLKTQISCTNVLNTALDEKKSCVIDNTNPDRTSRAIYLSICSQYQVPVRCIEFMTPKEVCVHNNTYRQATTQRKLPKIALNNFFKRYEKPELEEGFTAIEHVEFRADFEDKEKENEWLTIF